MAIDVGAASNHTFRDREYIGSLSPLTLVEFWNHVRGPYGLHTPILTRGKRDV
jgi:hypothetical protein